MKHDKISDFFSKKTSNNLLSRLKFSGLTKDATVLLIKNFLLHSNKSFFLEFINEEEAYSFYNSCAEHDEKLFVHFPETRFGGVEGFGLENSRYKKEAVLRLNSDVLCCCVGTKKSLSEKIIPKKIKKEIKNFIFIVGKEIELGESLERLINLGYSKEGAASEPGTFSHRGDILDIFPHHLKNPFRLSLGYDILESITLYNPTTQLSIKNYQKLQLKDYRVDPQVVDKTSLIKQNQKLKTLCCKEDGGVFSLFLNNWTDEVFFDFKNIESVEGNPKERANKIVSLYAKTKNRYLIAKNKDSSSLLFPKYFFKKIFLGSTNKSFYSKKNSFLCVSENEVFSKKHYFKKWSFIGEVKNLDQKSISTLGLGEYIVHKTFGIGIYKGIKTQNNKEGVEIEYQNNSLVFVSLDQSYLLHKYISSGKKPKISKLGSKKWGLEVHKTKKAAELVALDVLKTFSNKNKKRNFRFVEENDLDNLLAGSFSFVETPDQKTAINSVYKDMNSETPMDRLVCGDVGFGKTEVAIRAIFKSFLSDKLSVFLCPTTILADQHHSTCIERLGSLGVKVEVLSRFASIKNQKRILFKLKEKKIDVLIGTHRILSKDVSLPNLGLLIIDEEHRFGVIHKEKIRNIVGSTDTLTLTATPIPRTLQQSLVGLKSTSTILSPPEMRKPILTSVRLFNWSVIFSKIEYELSRHGQVYFLSNDIKSIPSFTEKIQKQFPGSIVAGASGKMASKDLEKTIFSFFTGLVDILVCTTIIESGLDVTNANSIIINNSQNLGLSQLYQLRGRVGRGEKQAHCLLLVPKTTLAEDAKKRLQSIEKNSSLGSGYGVSMEDLEIRGSGSVFGHKQSGHISNVGFHLYCDFLGFEIEKNKTKNKTLFFQPEIKTSLKMDIGERYVEDMSTRIDYYYKIGQASMICAVEKIESSLIDVFGPPPQTATNLLNLAKIRILYTPTPVIKINHLNTQIDLVIDSFNETALSSFLALIGQYKNDNLAGIKLLTSDSHIVVRLSIVKPEFIIEPLFSFVRLFHSSNNN